MFSAVHLHKEPSSRTPHETQSKPLQQQERVAGNTVFISRTPVLVCILNRFQIKNGTKISLLTSHPAAVWLGKFSPKATRKEGSKGLRACQRGVFVPFPSVQLRKCCQSFSVPSASAKVLVWDGTPGCRAGLYPCRWLHAT